MQAQAQVMAKAKRRGDVDAFVGFQSLVPPSMTPPSLEQPALSSMFASATSSHHRHHKKSKGYKDSGSGSGSNQIGHPGDAGGKELSAREIAMQEPPLMPAVFLSVRYVFLRLEAWQQGQTQTQGITLRNTFSMWGRSIRSPPRLSIQHTLLIYNTPFQDYPYSLSTYTISINH